MLADENRFFKCVDNTDLKQQDNCQTITSEIQEGEDSEYSDPEFNSDSEYEDSEETDETADQTSIEYNNFVDNTTLFDKIHSQMLIDEKSMNISVDRILSIQPEITLNDRDRVVSWIFNAHKKLEYTSVIIHNAIAFLNILISNLPVQLSELKLMTLVCYGLASKLEIKSQSTINEICQITGENFDHEKIIMAEYKILEALSFKLSYPTIKSFLKRYLFVAHSTQDNIEVTNVVDFLTECFIEKAVINNLYLKYRPSIIASAAVAVGYASTGDFVTAKKVISDAQCDESWLMKECVSNFTVIGQKIVKALKHFNGTSDPIVRLLGNVNFDYDFSFCC